MSIPFEVDGVPALFAESSGPLRAGLVFRVGQADEPLARRGITHLIEHLALHDAGAAGHDHNGVTAPDFTVFLTQGTAEEVRSFLAGVGASLRDLPAGRLPVEKEILRAEEAAHHGDDEMPVRRYGARGYGLVAYPEFGLAGLGAEDLREWADRYVVRGNAALWITGPQLPDGLRLDLPEGERQAPPAAWAPLPVTPGHFPGPDGVVVWDTVVPRETTATVYTRLLSRELRRTLRHENGLSCTAAADHTPLADGTTRIVVLADALPDKQSLVLDGVTGVLDRLRRGEFGDADLTTVVEQHGDELAQADRRGDRAPRQAADLLLGRPPADLDTALAQVRAVTRADVTRVALAAFAAGLLQTPGDTTPGDGWTAVPAVSAEQVAGQAYPSLSVPAHHRVIVGDDGATLVEGGRLTTVRLDACAAVLAWPDGARHLIGADGSEIHLEPALFHGLAAALPDLDRRIPAGLRADMAPRDPKNIPRPRLVLPTVRLPEEPAAPSPSPAVGPPPSVRRKYLLNLALCAGVLLAVVTGVVDLAEIRWVTGTYPLAGLPAQLLAMGLVAARGGWALRELLRLREAR
ncbi:hypothetical protein Aph02nite_84590 [Actinoplanes philippinensis]|uniref:Zinc protease n=1 Tax=Actinoplanes philippinensis TaxID=35752 RepID=A0A1I2EQS6_9ACTN|nr:insulinase family protein [Actinoplanes philippinensis]GIE82509.1 hypothetical protein Aph02nite_84590 [Actinoplanes philippinensis]SFE94818.1 zinc protease [Actinoplanes philippinensis]